MRELDHVALKVLYDARNKIAPDSKYTEAMTEWYKHKTEDFPDLSEEAEIAFNIRESKMQSEILESLILSDCPAETVFEAFRVPVKSVEFYKELFYDTSVFKTALDRVEYMERYPDDWGKELKLKAVNLGYEFVLFNYANLVPKTQAQKRLIERMFMATAYKAMAMNYNGIRSDVNRQAVKHAELMIKAYDLLVKTNSDESNSAYDLVNLLAIDSKQPEDSNIVDVKDLV